MRRERWKVRRRKRRNRRRTKRRRRGKKEDQNIRQVHSKVDTARVH